MADAALNAGDVVRAALALLDEVGIQRFTMRALADRLGTYPATIYWHVGNRGEVLSEVGGLVLGEAFADLPDPATTAWDEWLTEAARAYRRGMQRHPAMAAWAVTHLEARVTAPATLEGIVAVLARAGFAGADLVGAYNAYLGVVVGWVGLELIPEDPDLGADPMLMEAAVRGLPASAAPTIVADRDRFANRAFAFRWQGGTVNPLDEAFEFTLGVVLDGLRTRVAREA
jgi:AcrR family transcriptional regulator